MISENFRFLRNFRQFLISFTKFEKNSKISEKKFRNFRKSNSNLSEISEIFQKLQTLDETDGRKKQTAKGRSRLWDQQRAWKCRYASTSQIVTSCWQDRNALAVERNSIWSEVCDRISTERNPAGVATRTRPDGAIAGTLGSRQGED